MNEKDRSSGFHCQLTKLLSKLFNSLIIRPAKNFWQSVEK